MALLDDVRASMSLTSSVTDVVLQGYIDSAIDDMRRVGIREELLAEETMSPQAKHAVMAFCNAFYNVDSIKSPFCLQSYNYTVTELMNSDRSMYLHEDEEQPEKPDDGEPDDGEPEGGE